MLKARIFQYGVLVLSILLTVVPQFSAAMASFCTEIVSVRGEEGVERLMRSVPDHRNVAAPASDYIPNDEPALRLDSVRSEYIPAVDSELAGMCEKCLALHVGSLLAPLFPEIKSLKKGYDRDSRNPEGKTVLIYVQGHLVGAIKNAGNRSFLALRNVENSKGELVLVRGGVYRTTKALADQVRASGFKPFGEIRLAQIVINPLAWLASHEPYYNKDSLIQDLEKLAGVTPNTMVESHLALMRYLQGKIREARVILEDR